MLSNRQFVLRLCFGQLASECSVASIQRVNCSSAQHSTDVHGRCVLCTGRAFAICTHVAALQLESPCLQLAQAPPLPPTARCALLEPTPARRVHTDTLICALYHLGHTVGVGLPYFSQDKGVLVPQHTSVIQAIAALN